MDLISRTCAPRVLLLHMCISTNVRTRLLSGVSQGEYDLHLLCKLTRWGPSLDFPEAVARYPWYPEKIRRRLEAEYNARYRRNIRHRQATRCYYPLNVHGRADIQVSSTEGCYITYGSGATVRKKGSTCRRAMVNRAVRGLSCRRCKNEL